MKRTMITLVSVASLALISTASVGSAKNYKHSVAGCPPGLAKKNPPCVPPGQAKKFYGKDDYRRYRVGDRISDDFFRIESPGRYGLSRDGSYVRAGDYVYRVDRQTGKVLNLIGAVVDVLN